MADLEKRLIHRFQENLATIRKVAGWSSKKLADEIGVTRQTISNLESGKSKMTKTQYLALRFVIQIEVIQNNNFTLATIVKSLVDDAELPPKSYEKFLDTTDNASDVARQVSAVVASSMITGLSVMPQAINVLNRSMLEEVSKRKGGNKPENQS